MKSKLNLIWLLVLGLAFNPIAYADDHEDDDTMTVVEEEDSEEGVVEFIELPVPNENAATGNGIANAARNPETVEQGRDFGEWVSDQVRSDAASAGADNAAVAEEVRTDARDNARRDRREENGQRPENPGRP